MQIRFIPEPEAKAAAKPLREYAKGDRVALAGVEGRVYHHYARDEPIVAFENGTWLAYNRETMLLPADPPAPKLYTFDELGLRWVVATGGYDWLEFVNFELVDRKGLAAIRRSDVRNDERIFRKLGRIEIDPT